MEGSPLFEVADEVPVWDCPSAPLRVNMLRATGGSPDAKAMVVGERTMLGLRGPAMGCPTVILLDSCAEVCLMGKQFLQELEAREIDYKRLLRSPTISVVGAKSDTKLHVLGELSVPLTFNGKDAKGVDRKVGTTVTFVVTDSYDGPVLLSWRTICQWKANIMARVEGTFVEFERWPGVHMSDCGASGATWAEVIRVVAFTPVEEKSPSFVQQPAQDLLSCFL